MQSTKWCISAETVKSFGVLATTTSAPGVWLEFSSCVLWRHENLRAWPGFPSLDWNMTMKVQDVPCLEKSTPILLKMVSTCSFPLNSFQKLWTSNNIPIYVSCSISRYVHPPLSLNWETDPNLASSKALLNSSAEKPQVLPKIWSDCEERSSTKLWKLDFAKCSS